MMISGPEFAKDIKQFFEQLNIVGWYVSVPYRVSEDMNGIRKIHLDNFAGNDKVCFFERQGRNEEGFIAMNSQVLKGSRATISIMRKMRK